MSRSSKENVKLTQAGESPTEYAVTTEERQQMIADAAYYLAEKRGFAGGDPQADWLEAEAQIDARLASRQ